MLASPTCIFSLDVKRYQGYALLEMNPSLVFPIVEMLLGGSSKSVLKIDGEVTEIEQSILDGLYRTILHAPEDGLARRRPAGFLDRGARDRAATDASAGSE